MDWLIKLFTTDDSVAHVVLLYSLVISLGFWRVMLALQDQRER